MNNEFFIEDENGEQLLCKTVFTFDTDEYSYVIFSTIDKDGNLNPELSAMRYELDEEGNMSNFSPIESEEEWDIIEEVFNTLQGEMTDDSDYFSIVTDDGEEKVCRVIHRFTLEGYDKSYIFYVITDETNDEIFASAYIKGVNGQVEELIPIESEKRMEKNRRIFRKIVQ